MSCDVSTYDCSDKGLLMPFVSEYSWYKEVRIIVYLVGLIWSFVGLSIAADVFMSAIEKITSKTKRLKIPHPELEGEFSEIDVKIWNGTVANLTLMALGSSAPEILLNIIEVFKLSFFAGDLGPSTIVGSAAFNLLCISGVCLMSISSPEVRRIHIFRVFVLTAVFSVLAYVWLILVLVVITPDYIDLWEAVVTFLLFPFLVVLAYLLDKNYCGKRSIEDESGLGYGDENVLEKDHADKQVIVEVLRRLKSKKNIDEKDVAQLTSHLMEQNKSHDRGWYRINAIRNMTGSPSLQTPMNKRTNELLEALLIDDAVGETDDFLEMTEGGAKAIIEFCAPSTAVLEKDGRVKVNIMRHGNLEKRVLFKVETFDGTAEKDSDYKPYKETLVFEPRETSKSIEIEIIDDNIWEPDEIFFLRISIDNDQTAICGKRQITSVVILNDDDPGMFQFPKPSYLFKESVGTALVPVNRECGADGEVKVQWKTNNITAVGGRDFENTSGELVFKHGETTKMIEILLKDDKEFEKDENFEIELISANIGGKIGNRKRCVVTIVNDDEFDGFVSRITDLTNANLDALRLHKASWGQQFIEAMNVNGGDLDNATTFAYVMHFFSFGFKVIFALIPPPSIWGGWLCFFVSLVFLGLLTAIVGDLATIFGCLIDLKDLVTAITFVALGTSLPDLFASKQAAAMEKTADCAIGNVTGSNSVNVFLGLGFPWLIASIYWTAQGKTYEVPAGILSFSVTLYVICAVLGLALLVVRRYVGFFGKAELGGPKGPKIVSGIILIFLWIFYVVMSSLVAYEHVPTF